MPPKKRSSRRGGKQSDDESLDDSLEEETEQAMEVENASTEEDIEGNRPTEDLGKSVSDAKSPENPPVEDKIDNSEPDHENQEPTDPENTEDEPPAKKSKIAEEALKKIEAEKQRKEKEKQDAEEKSKIDRKKELDKFWKTVKDDPTDFTGWTHLLQFVDGKNDVEAGREAFAAFLKRYPYCYGYWKKFSDFEKRNGTPERVMEVFDQGTAAIPLSADLWIHYMNHCKTVRKEDAAFIRSQYERAMSECGREWRSDKLWDHYVKWEMEGKNYPEVYQLHQRIVRNPTQALSRNFETFKGFLKDHNPKDLMDTVDFLEVRKEVISAMKSDSPNEDGEEVKDTEAAPGEDTESDMKSAEETKNIREKIMSNEKKIYKETEKRVNLRLKYEEGIKRPYFHVKPLERGQLKNWNDYLEFMKVEMAKEGGDITEVEILYERSLIACALYEEFWINYISWWETRDGENTTKIRNIYRRACNNHLPTKVDMHSRWAAFEEIQGDFDEASVILENLEKSHPELISLLLKRINLERRRGNGEKACELYETSIKAAPNKSTASDLTVKYARFLRLHQMNTAKASQVIKTAMESDTANPKLYLQQVDLLLNTTPMDVQAVVAVLDKALEQEIPEKHKLLFSQRKVEFLEDFGLDIAALQTARTKHVEITNTYKDAVAKEKSEEPGKPNSADEGKENKNGNSNGSAASYPPVTNSSSYTAQQTQAYNNYGSRYANYPQNYGQYYGGGAGGGGGGGGSGY
eukprot:GFUD01041262.1.p1 GENE.GFUD01041262.1~~GFUD01041262.1.p1  ORF type:complete len:747 (+),score=270.92 GFUD01041262.1:56-2296(+)